MIRSLINKIPGGSGHGSSVYSSDDDSVKLINSVVDKLNTSNHGTSYFVNAQKRASVAVDATETEYATESWDNDDDLGVQEARIGDNQEPAKGVVSSIKSVFGKMERRLSGKGAQTTSSKPSCVELLRGSVSSKNLQRQDNQRCLSLNLPSIVSDDVATISVDQHPRSLSLNLMPNSTVDVLDPNFSVEPPKKERRLSGNSVAIEGERDLDTTEISFDAAAFDSPQKKKKKERRTSESAKTSNKIKKKKERRESAKGDSNTIDRGSETVGSPKKQKRKSIRTSKLTKSQSCRSLKTSGDKKARRRSGGSTRSRDEAGPDDVVAGASILQLSRSNSRRKLIEGKTPEEEQQNTSRPRQLKRSSSARFGRRRSLGSSTNLASIEAKASPEASKSSGKNSKSKTKRSRRKSLGPATSLSSEASDIKHLGGSKNFLQFDPNDLRGSFTIQRGSITLGPSQHNEDQRMKRQEAWDGSEDNTVRHRNKTLAPPSMEEIPFLEDEPKTVQVLLPPSMEDIPLPLSQVNERKSASDPSILDDHLDHYKSVLLSCHAVDLSEAQDDCDEDFAGPGAFAPARYLDDRSRKNVVLAPDITIGYQQVLRGFQDSSMMESAMFSGTSWEM